MLLVSNVGIVGVIAGHALFRAQTTPVPRGPNSHL